jgi:hypothetical protein
MEDRLVLNCAEVKKRLTPFLEDLLAEDEYQAYVRHLNTCSKCKDYVGRFGSLSNQIRELGNIKVPSDFYSATRFNISEPAPEPKAAKRNRTKNLTSAIFILAVISVGIIAGVVYFKKSGSSRKAGGSPIVTTQMIVVKDGAADSESGALLNELKSIATSLGVPDKKEESKEASAAQLSPDDELPAKESEAAAAVITPLHWHFQYSEKSGDDALKSDLREKELGIQKKLEAKNALIAGIEALEQKIRRVELGQQYSEKELDVKSNEELLAKDELRKMQKELEALVSGIELLKKEKQGAEDLLWKGSAEIQRKEADRKGKLMEAIAALNMRLDYQKHDILVLSATGEKSKNLLGQVLSISGASFSDFTAKVPVFPDRGQKVYIYLSDGSDNALHWHAKGSGGKKAGLLNAIRETGVVIDHESDELAVFSVPGAELKNLGVRMQAMGISVTEYGAGGSKSGVLSSGPVVVSLYFTD